MDMAGVLNHRACGVDCTLKPPTEENRVRTLTIRKAALFLVAVLACGSLSTARDERFYFTVSSDLHGAYSRFASVCDAINRLLGGEGAFHVSIGDLSGSIGKNRAILDRYFGKTARWFPVIGNHDIENRDSLAWLRNEYENGNSARTPLKNFTKKAGPAGSSRTTYSWDYGSAHFVVLNVYWNGEPNEGAGRARGSDTSGKGDIVPALYRWLEDDLAACDMPFVFVFGHEPAFPLVRHEGNSLDANEKNRDAFWRLLETHRVTAYVCGHTHYYSARKGDARNAGNVWQICAGSGGRKSFDGLTFLRFVVESGAASLDVYRDASTGSFRKTATFDFAPRESRKTSHPEPGSLSQKPAALPIP